ncbi:TerB family tellurite resistance protein [Pelagibacterales bacterium]|nr:TerB family tellurite resistance protein [Pelagibacterales bacterium]
MNIIKNSYEAVVKLLIILAYADSDYSDLEQVFIQKVCDKTGINNNILQDITNEIKNSSNSLSKDCRETIQLIRDKRLQNETIELLSDLIATDHVIHENELLFLQLIAKEWNMYRETL